MSYKALQVTALSKDFESGINSLKILDVPEKPLSAGDVRIKIYATALNYFDLLQLCGRYQIRPPLPFTPCCEGAGIITEVGSDVRSKFTVGQRVMFNNWGPGAAAQQIVLPHAGVFAIPDSMSFEEAAGFMVGYATAYHAVVQRGQMKAGETLLVTGAAGGMGLAAVQLGQVLGAKVVAAASTEAKLREIGRITGLPPKQLVNSSDLKKFKDNVSAALNGALVDVCYEPVGGDLFDQCVRVMNGNGRLLVIGFAAGRIPSLPINLTLVKGFSLVGVRSGAQLILEPDLGRQCYEDLLRLAFQGKLKPYVGLAVPFQEFAKAYQAINSRSIIGKAVFLPQQFNHSSKL